MIDSRDCATGIYHCSLYTSSTQCLDLTQRSQSLSSARRPNRSNGRYNDNLIAMRSYRRAFTPMVVLPVFSMFALLSEGAGCHRGLRGDLTSPKTPNREVDGQGYPSLYSMNNDARPVRQTVRLGGMWKGAKQRTTQKQVENVWVGK
ncbi:hypothetical protein, partial [Adlercreutzia sp. ZJ154]|uniref:hypothetical protein n=1 Tax=Adlercreutzia sp. ZJ154 TaxID=2709790 RepID=UPI0013EA6BEF